DDLRKIIDSFLRNIDLSRTTCLPYHSIGTAVDCFQDNMSVPHTFFSYGIRTAIITVKSPRPIPAPRATPSPSAIIRRTVDQSALVIHNSYVTKQDIGVLFGIG